MRLLSRRFRHRLSFSVWFVVVVGLGSFGCGTDVKPTTDAGVDAGPSPECLEAEMHSDLAWLQEKIFTPTCSRFNACHKGAALSAGGLNLEDGNTANNLIDQPSILFPDQTLVIPGDPMNSYLMVILGSYPGDIDPEVGTMPFNNPLLCQQKRDAIERWIVSLLNNDPDAGVSDGGVVDAGVADAAP